MSHLLLEDWTDPPDPATWRGWSSPPRPDPTARLHWRVVRLSRLADLRLWPVTDGAARIEVRANDAGQLAVYRDGARVGEPTEALDPRRLYQITVTLEGTREALTVTLTVEPGD